jgi:hypothetical protein
MDKSSTLGEFLPAVKTLAAWHLLAGGMKADAVRIFESAVTEDKAGRPIARLPTSCPPLADAYRPRQGRDCAQDVLRRERRISFQPCTAAQPSGREGTPQKRSLRRPVGIQDRALQPPLRLGQPTLFALQQEHGQQAHKTHGMAARPVRSPKSAAILGRKTRNPISVEFETVTEVGTQRGVATENGLISRIRFLKLDSDGRFALMIDSECDYWVVATPARAADEQRRNLAYSRPPRCRSLIASPSTHVMSWKARSPVVTAAHRRRQHRIR